MGFQASRVHHGSFRSSMGVTLYTHSKTHLGKMTERVPELVQIEIFKPSNLQDLHVALG